MEFFLTRKRAVFYSSFGVWSQSSTHLTVMFPGLSAFSSLRNCRSRIKSATDGFDDSPPSFCQTVSRASSTAAPSSFGIFVVFDWRLFFLFLSVVATPVSVAATEGRVFFLSSSIRLRPPKLIGAPFLPERKVTLRKRELTPTKCEVTDNTDNKNIERA